MRIPLAAVVKFVIPTIVDEKSVPKKDNNSKMLPNIATDEFAIYDVVVLNVQVVGIWKRA